MSPLMVIEGLCVSTGAQKILDEVTLRVDEGDFITIVGPNGAGKSTLLRCLVGVQKPDSGSIRCRKGMRIGYVPQSWQVDAMIPMTIARFLRLRKQVRPDEVEEAARETGISTALNKSVHAVSGGEWQRAILARALLGKPDMLILDEPGQNLDINGQLAFYKLLEDVYRRRKIGIVMVSHDLHMVMSTSRRVVCLYRRICCSGAPRKVAGDPAFAALFGSDMARLMAVYQHRHHSAPESKASPHV